MTEFTTWRSLVDGAEIFDIPDSGDTHQWPYSEGEGTTVEDFIGDLDGTINGASWVDDSDAVGGHALRFDEDNVNIDATTDLNPEESSFSYAITIDIDSTDPTQVAVTHISTQSTDHLLSLGTHDGNEWFWGVMVDGNSQLLSLESNTSESLPNQGKVRVLGTWDHEEQDGDLYINGEVDSNDAGTDVTDMTSGSSPGVHRHGNDDNNNRPINADLDNPAVWANKVDSNTALDDYNEQPWS